MYAHECTPAHTKTLIISRGQATRTQSPSYCSPFFLFNTPRPCRMPRSTRPSYLLPSRYRKAPRPCGWSLSHWPSYSRSFSPSLPATKTSTTHQQRELSALDGLRTMNIAWHSCRRTRQASHHHCELRRHQQRKKSQCYAPQNPACISSLISRITKGIVR